MKKHLENLDYLNLVYLYIIGLFAYLIFMPVSFSDTDLWYHMTGGRYFWQNLQVPDTTFFSFIEPEKKWINYFWGFQATTFIIYDFSGYTGLITFKAILITSSAILVTLIFRASNQNKATLIQCIVIIGIIYIISLRSSMIRPHLISYFFIPFFIYILTARKNLIPILPIATVIWVNMHGVEWPVGGLVCGAYIINALWNYKASGKKHDLQQIKWVLLCLPAILINPFGYNIFFAPFSTPNEIYNYIIELRPTFKHLSDMLQGSNTLPQALIIYGLIVLSVITFIYLGIKRHLTPFQIILFTGSFFLLARGSRFIWEWVLLITPLLVSSAQLFSREKHSLLGSLLIFFILFTPAYKWAKEISLKKNYPFDRTTLPNDSINFIKSLELNGRIISSPTYTGFIEWELGDSYKVHSDMEFPPFDEMDFFEVRKSFSDINALKYNLEKHKPDIIITPKLFSKFPQLAEQSGQLTPVFFDDFSIVYINTKRHNTLSNEKEIQYIDLLSPGKSDNESRELVISEYSNISSYQHNSPVSLLNYAILLTEAEHYAEAITISQKALAVSPYNSDAYVIIAKAQFKSENYHEAIKAYKNALEHTRNSKKTYIYTQLAECYFYIDDYNSAYEYFKRGFNPYINNEEIGHYFQYGMSALVMGDTEHAKRLLNMLLIIDDNKHPETISQAQNLLHKIETNEFN